MFESRLDVVKAPIVGRAARTLNKNIFPLYNYINVQYFINIAFKMVSLDDNAACHSCTAGSGLELFLCERSPSTLLPTPWGPEVLQGH